MKTGYYWVKTARFESEKDGIWTYYLEWAPAKFLGRTEIENTSIYNWIFLGVEEDNIDHITEIGQQISMPEEYILKGKDRFYGKRP